MTQLQAASRQMCEMETARSQSVNKALEMETEIARLNASNNKLEEMLAHSKDSAKQLVQDANAAWADVAKLQDTCKQQNVARSALVAKLDAARENRDSSE